MEEGAGNDKKFQLAGCADGERSVKYRRKRFGDTYEAGRRVRDG